MYRQWVESPGRSQVPEALTRLSAGLGVLGLVLLGAVVAGAETVEIPGGIASLDRLMGVGNRDPQEFLLDLNRVLLRETDPDNQWERVDARVKLDTYLKDVADFERRLSSEVTIGAASKADKKIFKAFTDELGYGLKLKKGAITLVPKDDDRAVRRRELAQVLGWDVLALETLEPGETETFTIGRGSVELPLAESDWALLLGGSLTPDGRLRELVRDQKLGLTLHARSRMSAETAAAVRGIAWRKLAEPLHRYAPALEVRGGGIVVPGGEESRRVWSELVGVPPDSPAAFFDELLDRKRARPAYLWHALSFVPPARAGLYLGASGSRGQFVRKLYRRLDEAATERFDHSRGGDLGFGTFVRSLPIDNASGELALPGGLGLWFTAIKSADAPAEHGAVRRIADKGLARQLDEGEFLQRVLTEEAKVLGVKRPVLPRLIRTANLFPGREDLLTPEVVVLAARASDTFRLALGVLHDLRPERPEDIREYLLAVAHLDSLPNTIDRELLILNFQGGVEWLRAMSRAEKVDAELLSRSLRKWSHLHLRASRAPEAAAAQLEWIRALIEALPAIDDEWGRGPYERALVHALVGTPAEQQFSWQGLDYQGSRGRDLSLAMARRLERLGIPSADLVVGFAREFDKLGTACEQESLDDAKSSAKELRRMVRELPEVSERFTGPLKELSERGFPGGSASTRCCRRS